MSKERIKAEEIVAKLRQPSIQPSRDGVVYWRAGGLIEGQRGMAMDDVRPHLSI